jgi:hypothetical protein
MAKKEKEYRRVYGKARRFLGLGYTSSLWLGKDHVLCIHSSRYVELYNRFYYRDIQAVITRKTRQREIGSAVLGLLAMSAALVAVSTKGDGAIVAWSGAGLLVVSLLIQWLRGPTCVCHLRTAAHLMELPSLNRLRTARKAINTLQPLIAEAQGTLSAEEWQAKAVELASAPQPSMITPAVQAAQPAVPYNGRFHETLFYLLLVSGGLNALDVFYNFALLNMLGVALMLAMFVCAIGAMIKQEHSDMGSALPKIVLSTLIYLCVGFMINIVYIFVLTMKRINFSKPGMSSADLTSDLAMAYLSVRPLDYPGLLTLYIVFIICSFSLGVLGLVLIRRFRARYEILSEIVPR